MCVCVCVCVCVCNVNIFAYTIEHVKFKVIGREKTVKYKNCPLCHTRVWLIHWQVPDFHLK